MIAAKFSCCCFRYNLHLIAHNCALVLSFNKKSNQCTVKKRHVWYFLTYLLIIFLLQYNDCRLCMDTCLPLRYLLLLMGGPVWRKLCTITCARINNIYMFVREIYHKSQFFEFFISHLVHHPSGNAILHSQLAYILCVIFKWSCYRVFSKNWQKPLFCSADNWRIL